MKNIFLLAAFVALGLVAVGATNSFATSDTSGDPIYMNYNNIQGDVTAAGHEKWIELNSFQWGVGRAISSPTGGSADREASAPSISEIVVTKQMDKSSTQLVHESLIGRGVPVTIDFVKFTGKGSMTYAQYKLDNALVSGYSVSSGGDNPTESISINFEKIIFTFFDPTLTIGSTVCWDGAQAKLCVAQPQDTTPPTVTGTVDHSPNVNGWYNSTVKVTWTGTDSGSGVASCDAPTNYAGPDSLSIILTGHCTDNAGNVGTGNVVINYDATPPTITGAPTMPANANGWYNTTVLVHFTASDLLSGLASVTPDTAISTEGANQQVTGTAIDNASNSASFTVSGINIDKTPPTVAGTRSRSPDHNGWYNHPLAISWTGTDTLSGIDSCDTPTNYAGPDGTSIILTGHCLDKAGNKGSSAVAIKYDITPPSLAVSANMTVFPTNPSGALVTYAPANVTDDEPSSASCAPSSGSQFAFGADTVICKATDDAGNNATKTFTITVLTPAQADQKLAGIVNGMNLQGGEANSLDAKLAAALSSITSKGSTTAKNQLNAFINEVNAQTGKKITPSQASQLITDVQDIVNSLS